ncbi:MAG: hypothetical protein EX254_08525 [Flavobacteriaceae bacterium]|nr:MAG: hypothetical protein EX254_08525 [Flavobacteriaceae bacterium]
MKSIAIIQSNYIPWKGYFDIINSVDEFVLYDDMQYTKRDWRNRNKIKTSKGTEWLSMPVAVKGKYLQKIKDTYTVNDDWRRKHWKSILSNYSKAPFLDHYRSQFEELYLNSTERNLSKINFAFINLICRLLEIDTELKCSSDYDFEGKKTKALLEICKLAEATEYWSGPSAEEYLNQELFNEQGIGVKWMDYSGYEEYNQLYGEFDHYVSVIDLLFNEGPNARKYMKSFKEIAS